jgi:hypothetical protein
LFILSGMQQDTVRRNLARKHLGISAADTGLDVYFAVKQIKVTTFHPRQTKPNNE